MACARCKSSFYCSKDCQKADWKSHRSHRSLCSNIADSWIEHDEQAFGSWSPRVNALLSVRPVYACMFWGNSNMLLKDLDGTVGPLLAPVTLATPSLEPSVALKALELANEARAAICTAGDEVTRRRYYEIEFSILQLAASPQADTSEGEMTGGNAEAQYRMGIYYRSGLIEVCHGQPRLKSAIFWMVQANLQGYAPARAWLNEHGF